MLTVLILFAVLSSLAPWVTKRLGPKVFYVLALLPFGALIHTIILLPDIIADRVPDQFYPWIPVLDLGFSLRMDMLSWIMSVVVLGIGTLVLVYSASYFKHSEPKLGLFAAFLLGFAGTMYGLIISDDIIMMFIFWEITTILSYLLIGHYSNRKESRGAAIEAMMITTIGGLAMLVGIVMLINMTGTARLSEIVASPLEGPWASVAMILVLAGAFSKAAQLPFHFWLPAAMAAPTPVSAYLHAAAMVKAGIYLIARLAPDFISVTGWREIVVIVGISTMLVGGWRAVRQYDIKLLLAYGTVSQLGMLTAIIGYGNQTAMLAGLTLLLAHALFKAGLFLVVGIIDHQAGTRDLRQLSGIGKKAPVLAISTWMLGLSMIGLPPMVGFVGKEATLAALLFDAGQTSWIAIVAVIGIALGSVLTTAYTLRFLWGALAKKPETEDTKWTRPSAAFLGAPVILAVLSIAAGVLSPMIGAIFENFSMSFTEGLEDYHLALWHGFDLALIVSLLSIGFGVLLFYRRREFANFQANLPEWIDFSRTYWNLIRLLNHGSARIINFIQNPGLPGYMATILVVFILGAGTTALMHSGSDLPVVGWDYPSQPMIGLIIIVAAIAAAMAAKRMTGVLLAGITGYGVVALFAFAGAPDLALTQALVETVTLVTFVLVLRRLPSNMSVYNKVAKKGWRIIVATLVAITMAVVGYIGLTSRIAEPISTAHPDLALNEGFGKNVVNVLLVDIRAWDTLGEISVLVVVATGIASLIFVTQRTGKNARLQGADELRRTRKYRSRRIYEPIAKKPLKISTAEATRLAAKDDIDAQQSWLLAGRTISAKNRSLILEVVVRLAFHPTIVFSIYLLIVGHNSPGGGFAGGLVAGLALVARYLAAGRYELNEALPIDAGKVLGAGIFLAAGTTVASLFFGKQVMEASWLHVDLPLLGELHLGTPMLFDIGVYLVVIGLVLDILRSLGAEVDRQAEAAEAGYEDDVDDTDVVKGEVVP